MDSIKHPKPRQLITLLLLHSRSRRDPFLRNWTRPRPSPPQMAGANCTLAMNRLPLLLSNDINLWSKRPSSSNSSSSSLCPHWSGSRSSSCRGWPNSKIRKSLKIIQSVPSKWARFLLHTCWLHSVLLLYLQDRRRRIRTPLGTVVPYAGDEATGPL